MSIDRRRGYIRSTEQPEDVHERWALPSYSQNNAQPKETALNYDPSWEAPEPIDNEQDPELDFSMLTPDALEKIRYSAYEEGIEEGRETGFVEGRETGFQEGKSAGFDEGHKEGFQQGVTDGQKLIETRCQHLDVIVDKLAFPLIQVDHQVHKTMVDMVVQLSKAIIQTEVVTNSHVILTTLREAVSALPMIGRQITVYLNPEDLAVVTDAHSEESLQDRQWKLIVEPSLNRGDVQVACADSFVDYRMEDRIKQTLSRFLGQNMSREPEPPEDGLGSGVLKTVDMHSMPNMQQAMIVELTEDEVAESSEDDDRVTAPDVPINDITVDDSSSVDDASGDHDGQPV